MTAPTLTPSTQEGSADATARRRTPVRRAVQGVGSAARRLAAGARRLVVDDESARVWLIGPFAAAWAALIGLAVAIIPMLLVWMATPQSGLTWLESLRVAGTLWVVAHGVPVAIGVTTYSLVPWGLALVPILLLGYAGGWAARRTYISSGRDLGLLVGTAALTYAAIAGLVAAGTARPSSSVGVLPAVVCSAVVALVAFGFGAARGASFDAAAFVPSWLRVPVRSGLLGAFAILGFGAIAATASLVVHVDDAVTMAQSLHAGVWGGFGLLLLGVAYVPVLLVWASAYVLGAGVVIGPAIAVSPFVPVTAPTQLPPFPMLAAIPQAASPVSWALPIAGVVAGVLVGLSVSRRARQETRLMRLALAVGAAAVSGITIAALCFLASGSLGDTRLASLGPPAATVGVLAFVLVTLGAVPSAVVGRSPGKPALSVLPLRDAPVADDDQTRDKDPIDAPRSATISTDDPILTDPSADD